MTVKPLVGETEYALSAVTDSLGFLTRVIHVQINDRLRASGLLSISPATLSLLRLIQANPGMRQNHAARILLIQESNMANLVKDLIGRGLLERRNMGARGGLWISEQGERELAGCASVDAIDRSYASVLTDAEYRQLVRLLNRVYRAALA